MGALGRAGRELSKTVDGPEDVTSALEMSWDVADL